VKQEEKSRRDGPLSAHGTKTTDRIPWLGAPGSFVAAQRWQTCHDLSSPTFDRAWERSVARLGTPERASTDSPEC
jgi:hypothetical protein